MTMDSTERAIGAADDEAKGFVEERDGFIWPTQSPPP